MRKTILLSSVLAVLAVMFCFASPVRDNCGGRSAIAYGSDEQPLNTDYLRVVTTVYDALATRQDTGVIVNPSEGFGYGSRLVIDITVDGDWNPSSVNPVNPYYVFACVRGVGYEWARLHQDENLSQGRHTIVWTTGQSKVYIDGVPSMRNYSFYFELNPSETLKIGNSRGNKGESVIGTVFDGLWHSVRLFDAAGILRHWWMPDETGLWYDVLTDTFATRIHGHWIYGNLSEDENLGEFQ